MSTSIIDLLNKNNEPYPTHETVTILKAKTLFKNNKWWEAVLLVETKFGEKAYKKVTWYRWSWGKVKPRDGPEIMKWIRKEHKNINFIKNWEDAKSIISEFMLGVN
jgi:hypothetical protein